MRKLIAIIILFLFALLLWCTKQRHDECCNNIIQKEEIPQKIISKQTPPLVYEWNSTEAITNELWEARKIEILSNKTKGSLLQIIAPYFEDEGEELGISRAKATFDKLGLIDTNNVKFKAKLVPFHEKLKKEKFEGAEFKWIIQNENIQEIDNKVLIYFPQNSTKKLSNKNIISYIESVATSLKGNTKKIFISGHTDNKGKKGNNEKLALKRANSIKKEFVRLGIKSERISTISYGEDKPISDNDTESGRQKNRRVELEIK